MRRVSDDFTNGKGRAELHFGVVYADRWEERGLPPLGPAERLIWSFLRSNDFPRSVSQITLKVWGMGDHRKSARRVLGRMEKLGLVEKSRGGWLAVIPKIKKTPESGSNDPVGQTTQGGGSYDPVKDIIESQGGSNDPGVGQTTHGSNDPGGVGHMTSRGGSYDLKNEVKRPTIKKDVFRDVPPPLPPNPKSGPGSREEIEEGDGGEYLPTPSDDRQVKRLALKYHRLGWEQVASDAAPLFRDPLKLPTSRNDWRIFAGVTAAAVLDQTKRKNEAAKRPTSLGGLAATLAAKFCSCPEEILSTLEEFREQRGELDKAAEKIIADAAKERTRAEQRRAPAIQFPEYQPELDGPDCELSPVEWLDARMPQLASKLKPLSELGDDGADLLQRLDIEARKLESDLKRAASMTNPRSLAEHSRRNWAQKAAMIAHDLERRVIGAGQ